MRTCANTPKVVSTRVQHNCRRCAVAASANQRASADTSCGLLAFQVAQKHAWLSHPKAVQRCRNVSTRAASGAMPADNPGSSTPDSTMQAILKFPAAFWKFLRPHTIRGTILGTTAVTAKALMENAHLIDWALLPTALWGLVALLCGNGYIVGINQLYDVDIDAISKPFLPVAAGEMSPVVGWAVVVALAASGISIVAANFGQFITSLYTFGLTLGTIYSVPPLRLKRFPILAFAIIATVRGFLLNFGVYYATRAALGLSFEWCAAISFITAFVTIFATAIAITKDLPDVQGDQANNITTFATILGVKTVSLIGSGLLMANYVGAITLALVYPTLFNVPLMIGAHAVLLLILTYRTVALHAQNYSRAAIIEFYRWVWNLFYSEYLLLPFI